MARRPGRRGQGRRHYLDGQAFRNRRRELGWSQVKLSRLSAVSRDVISDIENGHGRVSQLTVTMLANSLQVPQKAIKRRFVFDTGSGWICPPDLEDDADLQAFIAAAHLNMAGRQKAAVEALVALRERLLAADPPIAAEPMADLTVTLADWLDQIGSCDEAQEKLLALLEHEGDTPAWEEILPRIHYHLAISYRRSGKLDEAERELERLRANTESYLYPGVLHHLGVLRMLRGRLDEARELLSEAAARYGAEANFREGLALRRLAEVDARDHRLPEAVQGYFRAARILAAHDCDRYLDEIEQAVERLVRQLGSPSISAARSRPRSPNKPGG